MDGIDEKDWKLMRSMKERLLDHACSRILTKIEQLIQNGSDSAHDTYLQVWKTLKSEDKDIAIMFDDLKRSNAILKLAIWKKYGIISDKEMKSFTEDTQERIRSFSNF